MSTFISSPANARERRFRGCLSHALLTFFFGFWALVYVLSGEPLPTTQTLGYHPVGTTRLGVRDVGIAGAFGIGFREPEVVIASKEDVFVTRVTGFEKRSLLLAEPLPFAISDKEPATVSTRRIATPVATFFARVGLRRHPATSSRVIAYTVPGMTKEVLRATQEWVKIIIRPQSEGWIHESHALSIEENEGVLSALFPERKALYREPGVDDTDVLWEGRVVRKRSQTQPDGTTSYRLVCENPFGERRDYVVDEKTWRTLRETDHIAERKEKGISRFPIPIAYTRSAPPYEVIQRKDKWLLLQLEDQGWARRDECTLDVRYRYSLSWRQLLGRCLLRTPILGRSLGDALLLAYRFFYFR